VLAEGGEISLQRELHAMARPADGGAFLRPADGDAFLRPADGDTFLRPADGDTLLRPADGDDTRPVLIHLKAVDGAYPLYGAVTLEPAMDLARALEARGGIHGAVAEANLMRRIGVRIGGRLRIGDAVFELRAVLAQEPDRIAAGVGFGPRVIIADGALDGTGLIRPGSLVRHHYRLRLPAGTDLAAWIAALNERLPDAGWRIRDSSDPQPAVKRWIERLTILLTLVGLVTLLIGGLGVGGAVTAYLDGKTPVIATLKCLGASSGLIHRVYFTEVAVLAAAGVAVGLVLGALTPGAVTLIAGEALPLPVAFGVYPWPLAIAMAFGLLTALVFTLWPLARTREVPAAGLFRDIVAPERAPRQAIHLMAMIGGVVALAGLAVISVADPWIALWFVAGAAGAMAVLFATARALRAAARALPRPRRARLRLALANIHRPGAPTTGIVVALGMGVALLVAVALVAGNIVREIEERRAGDAPAFFMIDIQPDQVAAFDEAMSAVPGVGGIERVPHLRGRITRIKGVPVELVRIDPSVAWVTASDRGITYAAGLPEGSVVTAGDWWPADYAGAPLISLEHEIAKGLGVGVGDMLTVNVLGREIEARIANLRRVDWRSFGINFAIAFAPGALEAAPQTHIATVSAPPEAEGPLLARLSRDFPNVTAIPVREVLAEVSRIADEVALAARAVAAATLLTGALVVAGAVAAGQRRRIYDAVILKVLGATRGDIARIGLTEFAILGVVAGSVAAALGTAAGYLVVTRVIHAEWRFLPWDVALNATVCLALALVIGFAGTWRALSGKPAPVLRSR
jgi:putative ABC transport system permease protein